MKPGVLVAMSVAAVVAWGAFVACSSALPVEPAIVMTVSCAARDASP
jgi:hypothetical protein